MKKITVLVPAYNESANLPKLVGELNRLTSSVLPPPTTDSKYVGASPEEYDWEYLFVNDGSRDNTLEVLRQLRPTQPPGNIRKSFA